MCKHIYNIKATANILDSLTNMHSEKLVDIYQMVDECMHMAMMASCNELGIICQDHGTNEK